MPVLASAPIDQFDEVFELTENDLFALVQISTGKTVKVKGKYVGYAQPSTNYKWSSTFDYPEDAIVEYAGIWYLSLQTPNLGKVPSSPANAAYWEAQAKSAAGLTFWSAGVYTGDEVLVLRPIDGFIQLARLLDPTRPYLSDAFELEFASGAWELMSERGYIGIEKVAHGFAVNDVLTWKAGAWNKYAIGDSKMLLVRQVVDVDHVIAVLIGARLKNMVGLTPGAVYYAQNDGTVGTGVAGDAIFIAISATEAILFN
jgi:hypothetical protein